MGGPHPVSQSPEDQKLRFPEEEGILSHDEHRNPARVANLLASPTDFELARLHNNTSQFLKIKILLNMYILFGSVSLRTLTDTISYYE